MTSNAFLAAFNRFSSRRGLPSCMYSTAITAQISSEQHIKCRTWKAGVKSTKFHLKRILGTSVLTYEEMLTTLTEIEACLNSHPLCPMNNDFAPLTSAHFLIGEPLTSIPRPSMLDININRLDRYQLIQRLTEFFWQRWTSEYLSRLQQRPKWQNVHTNLEIGNLVLFKDERLLQRNGH